MEAPQPTSQPEAVEPQAESQSPVAPASPSQPVVQSTSTGAEANRSAVYFLVTAIAFFVIGYGAAWLSFNTALTAQNSELEATVRQAVADAVSGLDLQAAAAPQADEPPAVQDVSIDDDPMLGPEDAPITIVEFSDFRCGYCARFHAQTLYPLLDRYEGQIRLVYRDFPVVGGEQAALAAECADDQGEFWPYHDLLFENQRSLSSTASLIELASQLEMDTDVFTTCLEDNVHAEEIQGDFQDAVSYGLRGTPSFFINGQLIVGAQPIAAFTTMIDAILADEPAG